MKNAVKSTKKPYKSPQLSNLGSVAKLTQGGQSQPGGDMRMGSVSGQNYKN